MERILARIREIERRLELYLNIIRDQQREIRALEQQLRTARGN